MAGPDDTDNENLEQTRHKAPAAGEIVPDRFETDEIFQRIIAAADREVDLGTRELFLVASWVGLRFR